MRLYVCYRCGCKFAGNTATGNPYFSNMFSTEAGVVVFVCDSCCKVINYEEKLSRKTILKDKYSVPKIPKNECGVVGCHHKGMYEHKTPDGKLTFWFCIRHWKEANS